MFQCKWRGCNKAYPVYNLLVEHVNNHILTAEPQSFPLDTGKESANSKSPVLSTSSGKNLSLSRNNLDEIDLMSETSGEDTNMEAEDDVECELCGSGKEQAHNLIVLCDGCDLGYHQKCHPVMIPDSLLKSEDSLWYCYNCQPASTSRR